MEGYEPLYEPLTLKCQYRDCGRPWYEEGGNKELYLCKTHWANARKILNRNYTRKEAS